MNPERRDYLDLTDEERRRDLALIEANRAILRLTTAVAFEEIGDGFITVNLTEPIQEHDHPFGYYSEDVLDAQDEDIHRLLRNYDPGRQFIAVLWKEGGHRDNYFSFRLPVGKSSCH